MGVSRASAASRIGQNFGSSRYSPWVWELMITPWKPSWFLPRSISAAEYSGSCGATAVRPEKRSGWALQASASRSLASVAWALATSAGSGWAPGEVIDRIARSTPAAFIAQVLQGLQDEAGALGGGRAVEGPQGAEARVVEGRVVEQAKPELDDLRGGERLLGGDPQVSGTPAGARGRGVGRREGGPGHTSAPWVCRSMNRASAVPSAASSIPRLAMVDMWLWPSTQTRSGTVPCRSSQALTTPAAASWKNPGSCSATLNSSGTGPSSRPGSDEVSGP